MNENTEYVWFDGKICPISAVSVSPLSYSLNYGFGCFEGIRSYKTEKGSAIFRLQCHVSRLFRSANILGIAIPIDIDTLIKAHIEVIKANQLDSAYLRLLCYIDEGLGLYAKNLKTRLFIAARYWGDYMGGDKVTKGLTLKTSSYVRSHPNSAPIHAKATANYLNSILALREAQAANCDEALMLDCEGFVAECSAQNIFMVKHGQLFTPDLSHALDGITRDSVICLAHDLDIPLNVQRIRREDLYTADEVFITGTAAEIVPVISIDYRTIANGLRGSITERLQQAFFHEVKASQEAKHPEWLTHL